MLCTPDKQAHLLQLQPGFCQLSHAVLRQPDHAQSHDCQTLHVKSVAQDTSAGPAVHRLTYLSSCLTGANGPSSRMWDLVPTTRCQTPTISQRPTCSSSCLAAASCSSSRASAASCCSSTRCCWTAISWNSAFSRSSWPLNSCRQGQG